MKTFYLNLVCLALLLFTNSQLYSQCKFEKDEKDSFTGKQVRETKPVSVVKKFSPPNYIDLSLIQDGDEFLIEAKYNGDDLTLETMMNSDDYLGLKLENSEVVMAKAVKDYKAILDKHLTSTYRASGLNKEGFVITPRYTVTKEDFNKLAVSPITALRITVNGGEEVDYELKGKGGARFMEAAKCFLED